MASEQLGEIFERIRVGLRRRLQRGALLSDPRMLALHDRLLAINPKEMIQQSLAETRFVAIDTETTGLQAYAGDEIVSIALIELQGLEPTGREFNHLINPGRDISPESTAIHHITNRDVADAPLIEEVLLEVTDFIGEGVLVGHHIGFDMRFLNKTLQKELLCHLKHPWLDTMLLYLAASGRMGHYTLEEVADVTRVAICARHTARGDAMTAVNIFNVLARRLTELDRPVAQLIDRQYEFGHF